MVCQTLIYLNRIQLYFQKLNLLPSEEVGKQRLSVVGAGDINQSKDALESRGARRHLACFERAIYVCASDGNTRSPCSLVFIRRKLRS